MNSAELTSQRANMLKRRPALSFLYSEWYSLIKQSLAPIDGKILELGSGGGFLKKELPQVITSDILSGLDVDLVLDAKSIGDIFPNELSNLILLNVFHHINDSFVFLESAMRCLKPGGRILMIEPANNIWSVFIYSVFRHEPFCPDQNSWNFSSHDPLRDSNQAQSWIVFKRDAFKFQKLYPDLYVTAWHSLMPFSYMMTGGFSFSFNVPRSIVRFVRRIERKYFDKKFGLFTFIVIERK
ncbi:class I SAM-dependent methyltransferase [Synechococcus sp. Cu2B8-bc1011]|uniref:class I SAM-dependent methyltransferase n=1 Tax=Synechococcus sp. Cu2B8-bc1011 TaxID=3093725 RepID=UPI0039B05AC4